MGHKAQLPSVEAACCCRALCIMLNIPVVASVCGHSCSSAELLHKVFQGCLYLFFFFHFGVFHLPTVSRDHMAQLLSGPAGNSHSGSTQEKGCTSRKKMKEGGRDGVRGEGGRDYFQRIFRACVMRQATLHLPTMSSITIHHSLLSLCSTRYWYGHLALCSSPRPAWQEDRSLQGP